MFRQGIVGLSLALLTATPVLAQMGSPPADARNTGGTQASANGQLPKTPVAGSTPTTGDANGTCSSLGTPPSSTCAAPGGAKSVAPATQPPRDLLHKSAA
jgi:hypothetical protein